MQLVYIEGRDSVSVSQAPHNPASGDPQVQLCEASAAVDPPQAPPDATAREKPANDVTKVEGGKDANGKLKDRQFDFGNGKITFSVKTGVKTTANDESAGGEDQIQLSATSTADNQTLKDGKWIQFVSLSMKDKDGKDVTDYHLPAIHLKKIPPADLSDVAVYYSPTTSAVQVDSASVSDAAYEAAALTAELRRQVIDSLALTSFVPHASFLDYTLDYT